MRSIFCSVVVAIFFLCCGCASIVSDTEYRVVVNSYPDGAFVCIKNEDGDTVCKGVTPITVRLKSADGYFDGETYSLTFTKSGYYEHVAVLNSNIDEWYGLGNIIFGGLIGYLIVKLLQEQCLNFPSGSTSTLLKMNQ